MIKETIETRRSVRTFDGRALSPEHLRLLSEHLAETHNPFGADVEMRILDVEEHGLSSPVILGAGAYIAGKVKRVPHFELAFGYVFEEACLYAKELGIGTVMLAASLNRAAFEKAMQVSPDEVMPCASPIGYPAEKMSVRETVMRRALKADRRLSFEALFFDGAFDRPLSPQKAGIFADALSMLRLAPSATNKQPWRAVVCGNRVHFYVYHSLPTNSLGDIQKVDVGIGLCHFDLLLREQNVAGRFLSAQPEIPTDEKTEYIISFEAEM